MAKLNMRDEEMLGRRWRRRKEGRKGGEGGQGGDGEGNYSFILICPFSFSLN
jgi:hypothetical protein